MARAALPTNERFLRHHALGSEALYEVLAEADGIVTAEVVSAPGLAAGTRVRILARAAAAMEPVSAASLPRTVAGPFPRWARTLSRPLASR